MSSTIPQDSQATQTPFKDQLDEAARDARQPTSSQKTSSQKSGSSSLIEKVAEYVPAASKLLGTDKNQEREAEKTPSKDLSGPPNRPEHDDHIAEFVREQHRSKKPDGSLGG
ncbi:hypothetical protein HD806DRAFT_535793 [Xylariaceae sp. AK1471]|nr:hypothetical protein HD806DRAFT_535793 [Xylariaceae sp. AK1471]